jgi:hypothetical protein
MESCYGELLWRAVMESCYGELLWRAVMESCYEEHLNIGRSYRSEYKEHLLLAKTTASVGGR